jgi:hypothetical protein
VTLDGVVTTVDGSTANSPGDFNVSLFHRGGLNPAQQHSLTISNTPHGSGDVDIDWLEIEVGDGNSTYSSCPSRAASSLPLRRVPSQDVWLDDTSANITYDKSWAVGHGKLNSAYYNSTFRYVCTVPAAQSAPYAHPSATSTLNAKATIDFYGMSSRHIPKAHDADRAQGTQSPCTALCLATTPPMLYHSTVDRRRPSTVRHPCFAHRCSWLVTHVVPAFGSC